MRLFLVGLAFMGFVFGCGATEEQLRTRAAFDLHCSADQLQISELDQRTRGVTGCGQQMTYVESCSDAQYHSGCTWVLNTDSHPAK